MSYNYAPIMPMRDVPAPHLEDVLLTASLDKHRAPSPDDPKQHQPPRVAIVGGSMGGCCAAIALASVGCSVTVLERMPGQLPAQGAGLVIQPDMAAFLQEFKVCDVSNITFRSAGRQYVDREGKIIDGDDNPQFFTSWDSLHRVLRAAVPDASYHSGCTVNGIETTPSTVKLRLSTGKTLEADLLVGADGPGSIVRSTFLPRSTEQSECQGYVAWRGMVPEKDAPPHVLSFLKQKFTVYHGPDFHILAYLIPGPNGEIDPGNRRVNWVWYCNWNESDLPEILTDVHGKQHGFSVPRGMLKPEVAEGRRKFAREVLPPPLAEMVCETEDIFVQAIHDYLASSLVFEGKVALVGDAGCILRPHTAAGTTKAAINAWAMAQCLQDSRFQLEAG